MDYKVFIDTDVIIDFLIDRQSHVKSSSKIFDLCDKGAFKIFVSTLCISNVHYVTRKVLGEKKTRIVIEELLKIIEVLEVKKEDLQNAVKSDFRDFEDAIQHSVAIREKNIKTIITRNTKDYKKSKISVFTPDAFLKLLDYEE